MEEKNYSTEIVKSVKAEFEDYKQEQLNLTPEQIFNNSHKTYFYSEMCGYFLNTEYLDDISKPLYKDNGKIIEKLYDYYVDNEYENISSFEAIGELMEHYVQKYHENAME